MYPTGPGTTGAQRQREALELEGVEVNERDTGLWVSLKDYGWYPTMEEIAALEEEDD